jgi:hypothetical protein
MVTVRVAREERGGRREEWRRTEKASLEDEIRDLDWTITESVAAVVLVTGNRSTSLALC